MWPCHHKLLLDSVPFKQTQQFTFMFLQLLRKEKKRKKGEKRVLEYAMYVQAHFHFDRHFSSPPFEAEVQGIHATDTEQFLFKHTYLEMCSAGAQRMSWAVLWEGEQRWICSQVKLFQWTGKWKGPEQSSYIPRLKMRPPMFCFSVQTSPWIYL